MNTESLRSHAREIFDAGLLAADPKRAIFRYVSLVGTVLHVADKSYDLNRFEHIYVVGAGKAGALMAQGIEEILADRITCGIVTVKYHHTLPTQRIELREAGHPVPDQAGVKNADKMLQLLKTASDKDLIICLLSGGGSALLPCPAEGITIQEKQQVTELVLRCGASIQEINAIRKHISSVKGGRLAQISSPATLVTLILSDVIGDRLGVIASGPTTPDSSTFQDCLEILHKYQLLEQIPNSVRERLLSGANGQFPETPKQEDASFDRTQNLIVASNTLGIEAAAVKAKELGFHTQILSGFIEGETKEVAKVHAAILKEIVHSGNPLPRPACVISGGETTVTIRGNGLGGRNQEFVLAGAMEIEGMSNSVIFSAGTDGTDGPTDAAGEIADGRTIQRAREKSLAPETHLRNNNSYHFFFFFSDLIITGPTHTNIMDLRILLTAS